MSKYEPKLVTIDQAIDALNKAIGIDPESVGRDAYQKSYIYKLIQTKKIKRYGPKHIALIDEKEIIQRLVG